MDILDEVTPCYRLVFVISPYGLVIKDSNILHVTKGENNDTYGDRNPFVMMIGDTTRLRICSAINGDKNHCWDSEPIPLHEDSKVKILQKNVQGELTFLIFINGELKYSVVNNDGKTFKKMKVFVSDKYYPAASVFMKHYEIENCKFWFKIILTAF